MEEEERRSEQSITQKGKQTVKKAQKRSTIIAKIRQILAVPVLGKIVLLLAIILIVALVLTGVAAFFLNMPNMARDKLADIYSGNTIGEQAFTEISDILEGAREGEFVSGIGSEEGFTSGTVEVSDNILIAAATDLVRKAYDLEAYGFVNQETYGDGAGPDSVEYVDESATASQKEVKSIKSKIIESYIKADNATYIIANASYSAEAATRYSKELVLQILTEGNPQAQIDETQYEYFFEILQRKIQIYLDNNGYIIKESLANAIVETIEEFNGSTGLIASLSGDRPQLPDITAEQILARMGAENEELTLTEGLIVFDGELPKGVKVTIDRQRRQMIVLVTEAIRPIGKGEDLEEVETEHVYYYNLDGWVTKYSRPYEFLLALHLATMAPEFAYQIATSPETNAKVIMDFKPTTVEMDLVVDENVVGMPGVTKPAVSTVTSSIIKDSDLLALEQTNSDINAKYLEYYEEVQVLAERKAIEIRAAIADKMANDAANGARDAARSAAASRIPTPSDAQIEKEGQEAYDETRAEVLREINSDDVFKDWCKERVEVYIHALFGITGIFTNLNITIEDGEVKLFEETTGIISGNKEEDFIPWLEDYNTLYFNEYTGTIEDYYTGIETIPMNYHSDVTGYTYELRIDGEYLFNTNINAAYFPIGGDIGRMIEYLESREPSEKVGDIFNKIREGTAFLKPEFHDYEIEAMMEIFREINKLENLYEAIARLPSRVEFSTYVPYIKEVTNHWFRNLTFRRDGTENQEGFDAYSEDNTRTEYQYYMRYFRWELDPLITLYSQYWQGDPFNNSSGTGYKYNVVERRSNAIEQTDNPRVSDNSAFIRSLLNDEEYIIYDGSTKSAAQLSEELKEKINTSKVSVNSYGALESMPNGDSEILVRNLKELFKDTYLTPDDDMEEFVEVTTQKPLANIFPDYKPYTPWPNVFERIEEEDWTAMMMKGLNRKDSVREDGTLYHYLIAPANGVITDVGENIIEFAYRNLEGELNKLTIKINPYKGVEFTTLVEKGDTVTYGTNIMRMTVDDSVFSYEVHILLRLKDSRGQDLSVRDNMEVPQREMTAEEIITLHNFIMNEGAGQGAEGQAALAAVIFNRIKYPKGNFEDAVDVINCIELTVIPVGGKNGSWLEKDLRTKLWGAERYPKIETSAYGGEDVITRQILIAISRVLAGYDPTRGGGPGGARCSNWSNTLRQ